MDDTDVRTYIFGNQKVYAINGGYLEPERIQHYEFCFGPLKSVTYRGRTVLCE